MKTLCFHLRQLCQNLYDLGDLIMNALETIATPAIIETASVTPITAAAKPTTGVVKSTLRKVKTSPFKTAAIVLGTASVLTGAVYLVKKYRNAPEVQAPEVQASEAPEAAAE